METVKRPAINIEYNHKNITNRISPYIISVSYTDNEHGQSDEVSIKVEDSEHRWKSSWYPTKGDTLNVAIGYENEPLLSCGTFEIDEIESSGPPDVMDIKGVSASVKKALRSKNSDAHENTTLRQIAEKMAKKHGYTLSGNIKDIKIKRKTQNKERDLTFLKKLAEEYGYIFKISDNKIVFYEREELHAAASILTLDRKDLISYNFKDKTNGVYKSCEVSYFDPKTKQLVSYTETNEKMKEGDTLKLNVRCENKQQAMQKAKAGLAGKVKEIEGNVSLPGNVKCMSGMNVNITGFFKYDGKYHIKTARHSIDRSSGYKTELEVYKIA